MLDYRFVFEQLSFLTSTFFILLSSMAECSQLRAMKSIAPRARSLIQNRIRINPFALAETVMNRK